MHRLLKVPRQENPSSPFLTPYGAHMLQSAPLLALGTLDAQGRPWATIWGGEPGLAQQVGPSIIGIRSMIECVYDPVAEALFEGKGDGEVVRPDGPGMMVSGLAIDLENRTRVKLFGRMVAGALSRPGGDDDDRVAGTQAGNVQLVVKVEESLGKPIVRPVVKKFTNVYKETVQSISIANTSIQPYRSLSWYQRTSAYHTEPSS